MFKVMLAILFKFICNTASFELFFCRRSFYLVKRSEFDHITDSLHGTHPPFHISFVSELHFRLEILIMHVLGCIQ